MKQQTLQQAWDDYNRHGRSMGIKESSIRSRDWGAKPLLDLYADRRLNLIREEHITKFFLKAGETRSGRSMNTTHSIVNAFFNYCVNSGRLKPAQNPMFGRRPPKFEKKEGVRIPVHEWPRLLSGAETRDVRDRAVVAVGLYTLLRDQEMASLSVRDVNLGSGQIRARITKSNTTDLVAISADLDYELRNWLSHYQSMVGPLQPDMLLLPNRKMDLDRGYRGRLMSTGRITYLPYEPIPKCAKIVNPIFREMGYKTHDSDGNSLNLGAHTLRRSGARAYYDYFVSQGRADALRVVQTMLHHENAEMTQHYIGLREDRQTRDQLVRGVTIFGLHNVPQIGQIGRVTDHGDAQGYRQVM